VKKSLQLSQVENLLGQLNISCAKLSPISSKASLQEAKKRQHHLWSVHLKKQTMDESVSHPIVFGPLSQFLYNKTFSKNTVGNCLKKSGETLNNG